MSQIDQWISDMRVNSARRAADNAEIRELTETTANYLRFKAEIKSISEDLAGVHAVRQALVRALSHFCPDHPLIHNLALRERIADNGIKALNATNSWQAVKDSGLKYPVYDEVNVVIDQKRLEMMLDGVNIINGATAKILDDSKSDENASSVFNLNKNWIKREGRRD